MCPSSISPNFFHISLDFLLVKCGKSLDKIAGKITDFRWDFPRRNSKTSPSVRGRVDGLKTDVESLDFNGSGLPYSDRV